MSLVGFSAVVRPVGELAHFVRVRQWAQENGGVIGLLDRENSCLLSALEMIGLQLDPELVEGEPGYRSLPTPLVFVKAAFTREERKLIVAVAARCPSLVRYALDDLAKAARP